ncbi:hypothetical protein LBMAG21_15010 [Armatimonadota bacterium]|nr:hypothetical protein LBMAG21_15010 [Armatimonadota bacterium]
MTPSRLRSWMQKYGNVGVLMVAGYFGLLYLWRERLRVTLIGLTLMGLGFSLLIAQKSHRRVVATPLVITPVAPAPAAKGDEVDWSKDRLEDTKEIRDGRDLWRVEIWWPKGGLEVGVYAKFYKNGQLVRKVSAHELRGDGLLFGEAEFKSRYSIIVLLAEPGLGHMSSATLFSIRQGKLIQMVTVNGEMGGPIFRNYDNAGLPEWVFDDFYWYEHREAGPKSYLVFKEQKDGTLKLWKHLPNPKRLHLPDKLGRGLEN